MKKLESEPRSGNLSVRIKPSVRAALEEAAHQERRTASALAEIIIEEWLRARGFLK